MNDNEWEYILLHSMPKEWIPMTDENKEENSTSNEPGTPSETNEGTTTEGEEVSGTSNRQEATNTQSDSHGGKEDTHSTRQGADSQSGGRVPVGSSGNAPGKPDIIPAGDAGKNPDGSWRTRKTERKSFGFQKRIRERKAAQG